MTASAIQQRKRDWGVGLYTGLLLGFGSHIGLSALGAVVGSHPLGPLEGGLFATAFIGLAVIAWAAFFRTTRGEPA